MSPSKAQLLQGLPDRLQHLFNNNREIILTQVSLSTLMHTRLSRVLTSIILFCLLQNVFLDMLCNRLQAHRNQIAKSDFSTSAQDLLHTLDQRLHLNIQDLHTVSPETARSVQHLDIAIQDGDRARLEKERSGLQLLHMDLPLTTYAQLLVEFLQNVNAVICKEERSHDSLPLQHDSPQAVKKACGPCIVVIVHGFPPISQSNYRS